MAAQDLYGGCRRTCERRARRTGCRGHQAMATAQGGGPAFEAQARRPSLSAVKRDGQAESEVQARGCRAYATPDDRKPLREQSSRYALANTPERAALITPTL